MIRHLDSNAIHLTQIGEGIGDCWIYEQANGLSVYATMNFKLNDNRVALIPIETLRAYLKRLDK